MGGGGGTSNRQPITNPEEQALAKIADEQWAEYQNRYVPLENSWMKDTETYNNPVYHNRSIGEAQNDYRQSIGPNIGEVQGGVLGKRYSGLNNNSINDARALSNVGSTSSQGVTDRYLRGVGNIIKVGQGQSTDSLNGLSDIAGNAVDANISRTRSRFASDNARTSAGGLALGAATGLAAGAIRK